jgi:mono/diheme cytochrome c family protein
MTKRVLIPSALLAVCSGVFAVAAFRPSPARDLKVTFYLGTECPVAAKYTPRIQALVKRFEPEGVAFEAVFPQASDDAAKAAQYMKERSYRFDWAMDRGGARAIADGVGVVPTAVLRDGSGTLLYRGPLDDAKVSDFVRNRYLEDAIVQALRGEAPTVAAAEPFGCVLAPGPAPAAEAVSFAEDVAPILHQHCVQCHRPGEVAPFSLLEPEDAKKWAQMIAIVAEKGTMPPWKAAPGIGDFKHENRLDDQRKAILRQWAEAGAPLGDLAKTPKPPKFKPGWQLGEPDLVLKTLAGFKLGADGKDEYWNFVVRPDIKEPVYIHAMGVRPGNRKVVHHVIAWLDRSGQAAKRAAGQPGNAYMTYGGLGFIPSGSLGGWAPGLVADRTDPDSGIRLEPGTDVVLQVHYHKSGVPETDQTEVALYFNKGKVEREIQIAWLANPLIRIPAGDPAKRFTQTLPIPVDVELFWLMPHMHTLGREMKATWVKPDGTEEPLIHIPDWDFNWQFAYYLKEPKLLPRGSRIRIEAVYDNSADNPLNPNNPPKDVRWGEETTDEMMLLVAGIAPKGQAGGAARRFLRAIGGG